ncbi:uncharacterized protein LOC132057681 [Lycium ferocissimum]|uniref:uncharacterized protein LOC132057681 n=1 Tax=Lycium ferocissimum TaxID=112874 RepID=UPI0028152412|nr:uncharacterized protein LOC132057681 [Lycium ferocissimum]
MLIDGDAVVERFIGIVHVRNTSALCLKEAIVNYLAQHSLSLSNIRGQCYDGASNMQGRLSGLKILIQQESRSAHAIHCFAHQLQLTLVGVSKKCLPVGELVLLVSNVLNVVGGSFKRMDELRESQAEKVQEALDMGEVESGKGLNRKLGLARAVIRVGVHTTNHLRTSTSNDRFNEERTDLLIGVACLNPVDSFSSFDINKILRMAELYPDDFGEDIMVTLKNQLETYIVDVRDVDERFSNLKGLGDLSKELDKAKKHLNYPLVFRLVKFYCSYRSPPLRLKELFGDEVDKKSELRNRMDDDFMSGCMLTCQRRAALLLSLLDPAQTLALNNL